MTRRYEHEVSDKKSKEEIEAEKFCSRRIIFAEGSAPSGGTCLQEGCQFCKRDSAYRYNVLLDDEIDQCKIGAPSTDSPLIRMTSTVLNPGVRLIGHDELKNFDNDATRKFQDEDDTITSLQKEEEKLAKVKNTKHRLEFINKYNNGLVKVAWEGIRKDSWNRKSA